MGSLTSYNPIGLHCCYGDSFRFFFTLSSTLLMSINLDLRLGDSQPFQRNRQSVNMTSNQERSSCCIELDSIFRPWILRRYIPPKRQAACELHGITLQKTILLWELRVVVPFPVFIPWPLIASHLLVMQHCKHKCKLYCCVILLSQGGSTTAIVSLKSVGTSTD
jgi:hypothetical protein